MRVQTPHARDVEQVAALDFEAIGIWPCGSISVGYSAIGI